MKFLLDNAFQTPEFMIRPEILRRIQAAGVIDRVRSAQNSILGNLINNARIDRMVEQVALDGQIAYPPLQFLTDLRKGVWAEIEKPEPINIYRRNLQRSYLDTIDNRLNEGPEPSAEVRSLLRGELRDLDAQLATVVKNPSLDVVTRRHLQDCRDQIAAILDPRAMRTRPAPAGGAGGRGRGAGPYAPGHLFR